MLVFDPSGTPAYSEQYSAPIAVKDLTNNASDRVFGIAINNNSTNIAVHGVETFFSDPSLRLQGKFATFNTGAGVAFHPGNVDEAVNNIAGQQKSWKDAPKSKKAADGDQLIIDFTGSIDGVEG